MTAAPPAQAAPPAPSSPNPAAPPSPLRADAAQALQLAFAGVRERILAATLRAGRAPGSVRLLAVSKTFGPEVVAAAAGLGQRDFGENYVQEAVVKIERLGALAPGGLEWHFIGPVQSNKTRLIASHFAWVQSLERSSIALRLAAQRPVQLPPLQVLLQVNISGETSKSGVAPQALIELAEQVAALPRLALRGVMAIPQADMSSAEQALAFGRLRELFEALRHRYPTVDTLSMGMSGDFEAAIAAGSTMVRVGSALFGERK